MKNIYFAFLSILITSTSTLAQSNQYLHFDRMDDFIEVPEASQYVAGAEAVTMAGWFYCDQLAYGQGMMGFRNGGTGDGEMYMIQLNNGEIECRFINNGNLYEVVAPAFSVVPEEWQHFAWVYDGEKVELFINSNSVGSAPASGTLTSIDTPFAIGQLISPWNFPFGGRIDEVSVWSRALNQTAIQSIMDNELTGDENELQLYYKFDQGVPGGDNSSVTNLTCEIGSGDRDGILRNFTLTGETSNFGGMLNESFQAISFPLISNKLISDDPFELSASASSGLPISYSIVSGPATVNGNIITLDGVVGEVIVSAGQPGDAMFDPANEVMVSFNVLDPMTNTPITESRSPVGNDVVVPDLGPIQLAAISSIQFQDLFSVDNVKFEVDGQMIDAKDWNNEHYTGWWTPSAYGDYTMNVIAENNYGASSTETVNFSVVQDATDVTANAGEAVWLNVNIGSEIVEAELPQYMGAYDEIIATLDIACPAGGCDPWDRISGVEAKGHNGEWIEIIRYITPYGVACNSVVDLTDFMSILQGKIAFRFYLGTQGNGFEYTLNLDYRAGSPSHNYSSISKLWYKTYPFGDPANLQPCEVITAEIPSGTEAAKLKLVSTGHGWGANNTGNAAEFHDDWHQIWVDGAQTFDQHNWRVCNPNPDGCNPQNGTWSFNRAGWCPGSIAPWFDFDMAAFVNQDNFELKYIFNPFYTDQCHANNPDCVNLITCDNCNDGFNPHLIVSSYIITLGNQPLEEIIITDNEEIVPLVNFNIYPNPSNGMFNIELQEHLNEMQIKVFNNLGQQLWTKSLEHPSNNTVLDLAHLNKGIYFLEIRTDKGKGLRKVVIE